MSDWKEYRLGDVISIAGGFAYKGNLIGQGDNYLLGMGCVSYNDNFLDKGARPYEGDCPDRYSAKTGDIVLATRQQSDNLPILGMPAIIPSKYEGCRMIVGANLYKVEIKDNNFDNRYIYWLLKTPLYVNHIRSCQSGTTVRMITKANIEDFVFSAPSKIERKRIADIIWTLDDKIEVNKRINENLEQQAQTLFKSWLKKCQDEVPISDLAINVTDYSKCNHEQVVLINSSDVTEGHFDHHILSPNKDLKGHFKKRFQKGDILYSQVRPRNRHWGYCTFDADNYLASTQLMVIRNKEEIIPSILLYQYIIDDKVWMDFTLKTETRSGTFPQGNYEDLSSIKVPFGADMNKISSVLENLYTRIYNNEQESRRLAELRDTLLPKLMSGEINVNEVKI